MIEQPPIQPTPVGALRFNTDNNRLEYFDGNQYKVIITDSPEAHTGGTRGIQAGGGTSQIEFINVESTGDTQSFGDLNSSNSGYGVGSSRTRMLFAGRYSGTTEYNSIDFITISSQGNATDFGDRTVTGFGVGACSDVHGGLG